VIVQLVRPHIECKLELGSCAGIDFGLCLVCVALLDTGVLLCRSEPALARACEAHSDGVYNDN